VEKERRRGSNLTLQTKVNSRAFCIPDTRQIVKPNKHQSQPSLYKDYCTVPWSYNIHYSTMYILYSIV
jgi:hypothetical protein